MTPSTRALSWPWAVLAWVSGLLAQLQQSELYSPWVYALAALAGVLLWRGAGVLRATGLVLAGWAMAGLHACAMPDAIDPALEGRDLDVVGRVQAMAQRQDSGWRLRFAVEQAWLGGRAVQVPQQVHLGWYAASASDELAPLPPTVMPGERWRMRVRLKAAHGHINPRGFDHELWLWEQGIRASGYVRQGRTDPAPQRLEQTWRHPIEWARQRVRDRLLERYNGDAAAGVLAALVTGDQAAIDRSAWDVFRATGVAHLMSISGLHVTMLGWLAARLLAALWRRSALWGASWALHWPAPHVAALGSVLAAAAYALFSGWGVPAQRTVVMMAVVALLRWRARECSPALVWSLAAVAVLSLDPWALLQPGFWLSFVAVGVLMATGRPPERQVQSLHETAGTLQVHVSGHRNGAWRAILVHLWALVREQALVSFALAPLGLLFFGQVSLVGLLANLVAIPWVSLLLTPLALLGVLFPPAWGLAHAGLMPLMDLLTWLSGWPAASWHAAVPPWPLALLATAAAVLCCLPWPLAWRIWAGMLLLPALLWQPPRPGTGHFELLAADVGQGTAVLVRTARHSLLYDTGPRYSPESDAGHRVLVPLLAQLGERLDVLMLSHRDSDHTGGAAAVLAMQPHVQLWSSLDEGHPLVQGQGHRRCEAGQRWVWDGVLFELLHPLADAVSARPNALSCVLRVQALAQADQAGASALLTGDVEAAQEREMLARGLAPVDLLLVPHHGSRTSSSADWLQALSPRLALVQAGYRNRFGHPAPDVMQRHRELAIPVLDSAHCGAATWRSEQPGQVRCERLAARRYWHHRLPP